MPFEHSFSYLHAAFGALELSPVARPVALLLLESRVGSAEAVRLAIVTPIAPYRKEGALPRVVELADQHSATLLLEDHWVVV